MSDEIEREVRQSLAAVARSVRADEATVQRLLHSRPAPPARLPSRHSGWIAPLLAAAAVVLIAGGVVAVNRAAQHHTNAAAPSTPVATGTPVATDTPVATGTASASAATRVHVTSVIPNGTTVGVGMPIVLLLSPVPTDSSAFTKAATVTVNGRPADGAWFWEQPTADDKRTHTVEAHYRPETYWPADATIRLNLPIAGLPAGTGLVYAGAPATITFHTGDAHISVVNGGSHTMVVRSNNKTVKTIPVSTGKASTPTYNGVKVVMQKGEADPASGQPRPDGSVRIIGPGYDLLAPWAVRLTESGEYVLAAPWNSQIGRAATSNGTTNLSTADARWFYGFSQVGDIVQYANTGGATAPSWDGYGDWNVPWSQWRSGGLLLTHE